MRKKGQQTKRAMNGISISDSNSDTENNMTIMSTGSSKKSNKWKCLDKSFQNESTTTKSQKRKPRKKLTKSKLLTNWDANTLTQPKIIKVSMIQERRSVLNIINKIVPDHDEPRAKVDDYTIDEDSTPSCSEAFLSQTIQSVSPTKQTPEETTMIDDHDSDGESIRNLELAVLEHYNISPIESSNSSSNTITNFQTRSVPPKRIKHKKGGLWESMNKYLNRQISDSNLWAYSRSSNEHQIQSPNSDMIVVTQLENMFGRKIIGFKKDEKDCWIILDPGLRIFKMISVGTSLEVVLEGNQHVIDDKIVFTGITKIALPKGRKISIYELQKQQSSLVTN